MAKRDEALVSVARFDARERAEEAWSRLTEEGVPATIVGDPAPFGGAVSYSVQVARRDASEAMRLIADPA